MTGAISFDGRGLTPEDEILARVVLDLGLAKADQVQGACDLVDRSKTAGTPKSLAEAMQEAGSLHPRFLSAVMKAVNSRMTSRKRAPGGKGRTPAAPAKSPAARQPSPPPTPAAPAPPARPEVAAPEPPAQQAPRSLTPKSPDMHRRNDDLGNVQIPEAFMYKRAPKGEGFSVRSKTDIASAWAAHKKGEAAPEPKQPMAKKKPSRKARLDRLVAQTRPEVDAEGEPPPKRSPVNPLERLLRSKSGGPAKPPPRTPQQRNPLGRSRARAAQEAAEQKESFTPAKRRFAPSGITQSIDVDDLRAELGIGGKAEPEAKPVPNEAKQKAIALQAFIKRIVRTTLHQQCLEIVLRQRLTLITATKLAQEAACRDREARRVLEDWKSGGLVLPGGDEYGEPQYDFSPAKADLVTIRDFMILWKNPEWHNKLLGWIIQEEGTR